MAELRDRYIRFDWAIKRLLRQKANSRGEMQLIGATTLTEYRKYIEKDAALERRFQPGRIKMMSPALTIFF